MYHEVKIPKILFLVLAISKQVKKKHYRYYNTTDLAVEANIVAKQLVRQRSDKKDYKFLEDTNFGGLRGNFSTVLTLRGLIKAGNTITPYYGLGSERLLKAVERGDVVLDEASLSAYTENPTLRDELINEARMLSIRESQAHIKVFLNKSLELGLRRDNVNFPKESVVKTSDGKYFIRALVNNYIGSGQRTLEYKLYSYWSGSKVKRFNMHLIVVVPGAESAWHHLFAIRAEELMEHQPLFISVDTQALSCSDRDGNVYRMTPLEEAIGSFTPHTANVQSRLRYSWSRLKERLCEGEVSQKEIKEEEFAQFLGLFLEWKRQFSVDNKDVVGLIVSASGGPDVTLKYSGGTAQKLELEHKWKSYLDHKHHLSPAWSNVWLFSEEPWDPALILKLFKSHKKQQGNRVPDVFLCIDEGERKAFKADWQQEKFESLELVF